MGWYWGNNHKICLAKHFLILGTFFLKDFRVLKIWRQENSFWSILLHLWFSFCLASLVQIDPSCLFFFQLVPLPSCNKMDLTFQTAPQTQCSGRQTAAFRANHGRISLLSYAAYFLKYIQRLYCLGTLSLRMRHTQLRSHNDSQVCSGLHGFSLLSLYGWFSPKWSL